MNADKISISVIIPCFNQGHFIQDAIDSLDAKKINYPFEIIIVNDGSTDINTINKLDALSKQNYQVIHQSNKGPSAARNTGIKMATGKYILPLDADNKITPEYINKSIPVLEQGVYSIAYAMPHFFGEDADGKERFSTAAFDIMKIVQNNYIDTCSVYNKDVWIKNRGYDEALPNYGHEDWDFWINAYSNGFKFYFIEERLYYYRIEKNSVITGFSDKTKYLQDHEYILKKHAGVFLEQLVKLGYIKSKYDRDIKRFLFAPVIFSMYLLKLIKTPVQKAQERFSFYDRQARSK
jgi:glycosyltransferase involved in cell wall biosynthesis